jgi:hypothetical protein
MKFKLLVALFALKWLHGIQKPTLLVLAMLAGAALANFAAVFFVTQPTEWGILDYARDQNCS